MQMTVLLLLLSVLCCGASASPDPEPVLCSANTPVTTPANPMTRCPAVASSLNATLAATKVYDFAPIIFFHPFEKYYLDDVENFLSHSQIYTSDQGSLGPATEDNLLLQSSLQNSKALFVSPRANSSFLYAGQGFYLDGTSRAHVYARVFAGPSNRSYIYNYHLFFSKNGCSNQQILLRLNEGKTQVSLDYVACKIGEHEGDWETISVEVCASDLQTIVGINYNQHAWNQQLNCAINNQCVFENGTHPRVYVGLQSHSLNPFQSLNHVYSQAKVATISNLDAFSLVDRFRRDPSKRWAPSPARQNIVLLDSNTPEPPFDNATVYMQRKQTYQNNHPLVMLKDWDPRLGSPSWNAFQGRFGSSYTEFRPLNNPPPRCLLKTHHMFGDCPNNALLELARTLLGSSFSKTVFDGLGSIGLGFGEFLSPFGAPSLRGKTSYTGFDAPSNDALGGDRPICPDPKLYNPDYQIVPPVEKHETAWNLAIVICSVAIALTLLLLALSIVGGRDRYKNMMADEQQLSPSAVSARKGCKIILWDVQRSIPKVSLSGLAFTIGGGLMIAQGSRDVFDLLEEHIDSRYWRDFEQGMTAWSPLILIFSVAALATAFVWQGRSFEYFCVRKASRCHAMFAVYGWILQGCVIVGLFVSSILNTFIIAFGAVLWGIDIAFLEACKEGEGRLSGVCLSLTDFGHDTIFCGDDLKKFCDSWRQVDGNRVLIGALIVNVGQLCFLMAASTHFYRLRKFSDYIEDGTTQKVKPVAGVDHEIVQAQDMERKAWNGDDYNSEEEAKEEHAGKEKEKGVGSSSAAGINIMTQEQQLEMT